MSILIRRFQVYTRDLVGLKLRSWWKYLSDGAIFLLMDRTIQGQNERTVSPEKTNVEARQTKKPYLNPLFQRQIMKHWFVWQLVAMATAQRLRWFCETVCNASSSHSYMIFKFFLSHFATRWCECLTFKSKPLFCFHSWFSLKHLNPINTVGAMMVLICFSLTFQFKYFKPNLIY